MNRILRSLLVHTPDLLSCINYILARTLPIGTSLSPLLDGHSNLFPLCFSMISWAQHEWSCQFISPGESDVTRPTAVQSAWPSLEPSNPKRLACLLGRGKGERYSIKRAPGPRSWLRYARGQKQMRKLDEDKIAYQNGVNHWWGHVVWEECLMTDLAQNWFSLWSAILDALPIYQKIYKKDHCHCY